MDDCPVTSDPFLFVLFQVQLMNCIYFNAGRGKVFFLWETKTITSTKSVTHDIELFRNLIYEYNAHKLLLINHVSGIKTDTLGVGFLT